jgi:hypothetical protein
MLDSLLSVIAATDATSRKRCADQLLYRQAMTGIIELDVPFMSKNPDALLELRESDPETIIYKLCVLQTQQ